MGPQMDFMGCDLEGPEGRGIEALKTHLGQSPEYRIRQSWTVVKCSNL